MQPTTTYNREKALRDYRPKMRRAQVIELGRRFGVSGSTMRKMMQGEKPAIPRIVYNGDTRGYYDRDVVLSAVERS
jgi:hypothetical protein